MQDLHPAPPPPAPTRQRASRKMNRCIGLMGGWEDWRCRPAVVYCAVYGSGVRPGVRACDQAHRVVLMPRRHPCTQHSRPTPVSAPGSWRLCVSAAWQRRLHAPGGARAASCLPRPAAVACAQGAGSELSCRRRSVRRCSRNSRAPCGSARTVGASSGKLASSQATPQKISQRPTNERPPKKLCSPVSLHLFPSPHRNTAT